MCNHSDTWRVCVLDFIRMYVSICLMRNVFFLYVLLILFQLSLSLLLLQLIARFLPCICCDARLANVHTVHMYTPYCVSVFAIMCSHEMNVYMIPMMMIR